MTPNPPRILAIAAFVLATAIVGLFCYSVYLVWRFV